MRIDPRLHFSILSLSFVGVACAPILGDDFEVVHDAATTSTTGAAGDGMDHGDALAPTEGGAAVDATIADAPPLVSIPDVDLQSDVSPTSNHLVINEVDYDQPGADTTEFVEIYNGTGAAVSLASMTLVLVNGANNQEYTSVPLAPAGSLANGQYLVVCSRMVSVDPAAIKLVGFAMNGIQNGAPDGVALVDGTQHQVIDALSYAGSITAAMLADVNGSVNLVEGTPLSTIDSATANGALIRRPNGRDTDDASADWAFAATPTPGAANSLP
jgi:hypothetical protein